MSHLHGIPFKNMYICTHQNLSDNCVSMQFFHELCASLPAQ